MPSLFHPNTEAKNAKEVAQQNTDGAQPPTGHPAAGASQGSATKCPFLAAQMNHKNSNVFCKASLELQEDVQDMQIDRKGMYSVRWSIGSLKAFGAWLYSGVCQVWQSPLKLCR